MLSGIFVVTGYRNLRNPHRLAVAAKPVTDKVAPILQKAHPRFPTDPATLVRMNAAVHVGAGLMLATGRFSRPAALVLAGTLVPVTIAGHPFWKNDDPAAKNNNQIHALKNLGLLGGSCSPQPTPAASRVCAGGPATASATLDVPCSAPSAPPGGRPGSPSDRPPPPADSPADLHRCLSRVTPPPLRPRIT
ncbi:hypothetical protein GCM10027614_49690 [Micromonospora vulcania]